MNRKTARENTFLLLFEKTIRPDTVPQEIFTLAVEERCLETDKYVEDVFYGSNENLDLIYDLIEKSLIGWKKERVSYVSRAILVLAVYEMMFRDDIPVKVTINEAIELSKKYDEDRAYVFVNGILNSIAEKLNKK